MSVHSISPVRPPSYVPLSGNPSQSAKFASVAEQLQEKTATQADGSRVTSAQGNGATPDVAVTKGGQGTAEAGYADPTEADASQSQSEFEEKLRANAPSAGRATSGTSGSAASQSSGGIALYKFINQIGNNETSASALLKSWNSIMQGEQDAGESGAATLQAFLQNEVPGFGSGILDVTA
jgi:hypothetical protein